MGIKRALIVDDSKSARVFLSRILEKYEIDVDSAENAEAAIEYLGHHRPDVIFMDHMMPGMDGFQAVQAIKNNPRTATIPIMMYTSQEGELYLGQARALGAVGVLPKQIKPTDVSKVLYELHLVMDRRTGDQSSFKQVNLEAVDNDALGSAPPPGSKPLTDTALREQFAELRRALVASIDTQSERITSDVRLLLQDLLTPTPNAFGMSRDGRTAWVLASLALIVALATAGLWWREAGLRQQLVTQLAELRQAEVSLSPDEASPPPAVSGNSLTAPLPGEAPIAGLDDVNATDSLDATVGGPAVAAGSGAPRASNVMLREAASASTAAPGSKPVIIQVPYGDDALSGPRLEQLRQVFTRVSARNYQGVADVKVFPGRYCLVGNATEGFSVAPDELAFSRCNAVGNPHEESLQPSQRESLGFANLVGAFRASTHGALDIQFASGDASGTLVPYPQVSGALTAGEWNRAAAANNRIEIRLR
ncbi:MAG: response regulator [Gammaproteobacteria bacterium]